jgi:hypothetical protein
LVLIIVYTLSSTKLEIRAKQFSAWKQGGGEGGVRGRVKGAEMTQILYAHMNKRYIFKK